MSQRPGPADRLPGRARPAVNEGRRNPVVRVAGALVPERNQAYSVTHETLSRELPIIVTPAHRKYDRTGCGGRAGVRGRVGDPAPGHRKGGLPRCRVPT